MRCPFCNAESRRGMLERVVHDLAERFDRLKPQEVERIVLAMQEADPALAMGVAELMLASRDLHELVTTIARSPMGRPN